MFLKFSSIVASHTNRCRRTGNSARCRKRHACCSSHRCSSRPRRTCARSRRSERFDHVGPRWALDDAFTLVIASAPVTGSRANLPMGMPPRGMPMGMPAGMPAGMPMGMPMGMPRPGMMPGMAPMGVPPRPGVVPGAPRPMSQ